jgi:stage II sporulation protein D
VFLKCYKIFQVIFLLLISVSTTLATENKLKIGLFNLLKPKTIDIKVIGEEVIRMNTINSSTPTYFSYPSLISSGQSLTLVISGNNLACYLRNSKGKLKSQWIAKQLSLSGNSSLELNVANRLTRQIPAQVTFQSLNSLIQSTLSIDQEEAVKIITASELSLDSSLDSKQALEIFKVLSICVRSYVYSEKSRHNKDGYDFCDNTHCLLYFGEDGLAKNQHQDIIKQAVLETTGLELTYQGHPVPGYFTACCGGLTALPTEVWTGKQYSPYLFPSVKCSYCRNDKFYKWERSISTREIWKALEPLLSFNPSLDAQLIPIYNNRGFVTSLLVKEHNHQTKIPVSQFRHLIGQKLGWNIVLSNVYSIKLMGNKIIFQGKGFGHNLGLCLSGATEQARQGYNFSQILQFYFPKTTLSE